MKSKAFKIRCRRRRVSFSSAAMASRGRVLRATIAEPICSAEPSTSLALCVAVRWRSRRLRMSKSSEGAGDLTSQDKSKSAIAAGSVEFASNDSVEAAERKGVVQGKGVSVCVEIGGRRVIKKK